MKTQPLTVVLVLLLYCTQNLAAQDLTLVTTKSQLNAPGDSSYYEKTQHFKNLIDHYLQIGNYEKGMEASERGLEFTLIHPQKKDADLVFYYFRLGRILTAVNESKRAIEHVNKALFIIENHRDEADFSENNLLPYLYRLLGANYFNLGDLESADFYYNKSLTLFARQPGEIASRYTISNILSIGSIYIREKKYETALQYLARADSLVQLALTRTNDPDFYNHQLRGLRWQYGTIWLEQNELEKAKKCFAEIAEKYPVKGQKWEDASTYYHLAAISEKEGDWESALQHNQQAIIASCNTFDSFDYFALPACHDFRELGNTYWLLNQKARYLANSSQVASDESKKQRCYTTALKAVDLFDQLHTNKLKKMNAMRDGHSRSLINVSLMNYKTGLTLGYDAYLMNPTKEILEKTFYYAQKMKAQQLWLSLQSNDAANSEKVPEALLAREKQLLADIQIFEKKIFEAQSIKDTQAVKRYANDSLFESRRAYTKLMQEMEISYPAYFKAKYDFVPQTEASLQEILKETELFVEYAFVDEALFIFTLAQNQALSISKVPLEKKTVDRINSLYKLLKKPNWMRRSNREKLIRYSYLLYQQFLQPIQEQLKDKKRLIVIGDGITNFIPFEVLIPSEEIKQFQHLDYLIKNHEVSYHYSAILFAKARKQTRTQTFGMFAFAPVYEKMEDQINLMALQEREKPANPNLRAFDKNGWLVPLPESEREVLNIMDLFEKNSSQGHTLALRAEASESVLKGHLEKPYQFVHIAGHSFADLENPRFSGIACFEETEEPNKNTTLKEDGILYTGEIYNLSTQADLVTLSSCESGYGKLEISEGVLGLNRAFVYAGTPNVVFSLWNVYDKVCAELMVDFYQHILSGESYSASLREAKLNLLKREATAAPHFWSPYLLIGR